MFIIVASNTTTYMTSPDAADYNWTSRTLPVSANWQAIAANSSMVMVVGSGTSTYLTSTDGISWTQRTFPSSNTWNRVCWTGTYWVVVNGSDGTALYSADGISWQSLTQIAAGTWGGIATNGANICVTPSSGKVSSLITIDNTKFNVPIITQPTATPAQFYHIKT
jgi:hypothetical protein